MSSTLLEPIGLPALGQGRVFWFPTIADLEAPKVSEATLNLSMVPDAGWEPTFEQAAGSHMKYGSDSEYEVPGKGKWTGGSMVSEWDPQNPDDDGYAHIAALAEGTLGYLGLSLGFDAAEPLADGHILNLLWPTRWGKQVPVNIDPSNDGQLLQVTQRYFITGRVLQNIPVIAGS